MNYLEKIESKYSYDTLLTETDLDAKVRDILIANGIKYYGQLYIHSLDYYKSMKKIGAKALTEIKCFLKRSLGTNNEETPGNWVFSFAEDARDKEARISRRFHEMNRAIANYADARAEGKRQIDLYYKLIELEEFVAKEEGER